MPKRARTTSKNNPNVEIQPPHLLRRSGIVNSRYRLGSTNSLKKTHPLICVDSVRTDFLSHPDPYRNTVLGGLPGRCRSGRPGEDQQATQAREPTLVLPVRIRADGTWRLEGTWRRVDCLVSDYPCQCDRVM